MCGIAGYSGLSVTFPKRATLLYALGSGIQARGRDAWGYAGHTGERTIASKGLGPWTGAPFKQLMRASTAETVSLHARFGTHGSKTDRDNAHPFTIKRPGDGDESRIVLHGMHNGVLQGTHASAKKHDRTHTVDSRELFELMADGLLDEAADLTGYGLLVWAYPGDPMLRIMKLTRDADLYMVKLSQGGVVFASTKNIVEAAIKEADMGEFAEYDADYHEPGFVMGLQHGILYDTREKGFTLKRQETKSWESYTESSDAAHHHSAWTNPRNGLSWYKCDDGHWRPKGEVYPVKHNVCWVQAGKLPLIPKPGGGTYMPKHEGYGVYWRWGKHERETGSGLKVYDDVVEWNDKSLGWFHYVMTAGSDKRGRRYTQYHEIAKCAHGKLPNEPCDPCDEGEWPESESPSAAPESDAPPSTERADEKLEHTAACKLHLGTDPDCEACWEDAVSDIINRNQFTG